ncbi:zf-HC2 domain-containing protein [Haloechinothrix sp. YIM 98757]|uniref:Zf-HC2 domain-containing protein n=1 Tax=Haloechinothrix aidingensis TaxID=2752311 RepID=A0A838A5X9_9PSEU|nr:zf-HC2 domain-containing protein [Haloechinothrix aidingensis]MBA0124175.1 zf-HC2 domain-containing protein [Haloechinothrix aidingensis]
MISCSEAVRQLWEYLDGLVGDRELESIEAHLARCRRCCGELEFARELRGTLERASEVDVPDAVLRRLTQTLEDLEP